MTEKILEETEYVEDATENGYPKYSETEAVNAPTQYKVKKKSKH